MSGISRLLRWAPCLFAISRVVSNSGQAQRSHIINAQSSSQHPSGSPDLLHTLSFPARTVVRNSQLPRPLPAPRPLRTPSPTLQHRAADPGTGSQWAETLMRTLTRTRTPQVHFGWQWEYPHRLPFRLAFRAGSISSKIISQVRGVCFAPTLPIELQEAILITARHSVRRSGAFNEGDLRLVSRHFNEVHRKHFWKKKWLNLRPFNASWLSIGERIQAIASNDAIKNVKLEGTLTDITPTSLEEALRQCPELAGIRTCRVERIKVGRLDNLNEILFKKILLHHQNHIRLFQFQFGDTVLFLGRQSMFAGNTFRLPSIRRVIVDISDLQEARLLEELHGNGARLVSRFLSELIGEHNRDETRRVELRLLCKPEVRQQDRRPRISSDHLILAAQIFNFTRQLLANAAGLKLVFSFQAPVSVQLGHNQRILTIWSRANRVSLINT